MTLEIGPRRRPRPHPRRVSGSRYYAPPYYGYAREPVLVIDARPMLEPQRGPYRAVFKKGDALYGTSPADVVKRALSAGRIRDLVRVERWDASHNAWVPAS